MARVILKVCDLPLGTMVEMGKLWFWRSASLFIIWCYYFFIKSVVSSKRNYYNYPFRVLRTHLLFKLWTEFFLDTIVKQKQQQNFVDCINKFSGFFNLKKTNFVWGNFFKARSSINLRFRIHVHSLYRIKVLQ